MLVINIVQIVTVFGKVVLFTDRPQDVANIIREDLYMNAKKIIAAGLLMVLLLMPASIHSFAHTHEFGPSQFDGVEYLKENPFSSGCAIRYTYHTRACNLCGVTQRFVYSSQQMNHNYQNNKCIYCGMVITRNN